MDGSNPSYPWCISSRVSVRPSAALASSGRAGLHNRREWGLITKYVNYSTTKTTLNMIQVFEDGKDKYFLDYQNSDTGLSSFKRSFSIQNDFWWLALNIKCWIRNRIFVSIFTMKILMEKWIFQQEIWIFIIYSCEMSSRWQRSQWRMVPGAVGLLPTLFISRDINNIIFHNLIQPPLTLVLKHESRNTCCCHYFWVCRN